MADLSNSSFIPKQGPVKKRRRAASKKVYIISIVSFVLVLATILGAGAVYFYAEIINQQRDEAVAALNNDIATFSEVDMQKVQEFDRRLSQVNERFQNRASIVSIFESLEDTTIDTSNINSLTLTREEDTNYVMSLSVDTDSLDSTIFQREIYGDSNLVDSVIIQSLNNSGLSQVDNDIDVPPVDFIAEITIPISSIPNLPIRTVSTEPGVDIQGENQLPLDAQFENESVNQNES